MNAFISGAIHALEKAIGLIDSQENPSEEMLLLKKQLLLYIEMYKEIERRWYEIPIPDNVGENLAKIDKLLDDEKKHYDA